MSQYRHLDCFDFSSRFALSIRNLTSQGTARVRRFSGWNTLTATQLELLKDKIRHRVRMHASRRLTTRKDVGSSKRKAAGDTFGSKKKAKKSKKAAPQKDPSEAFQTLQALWLADSAAVKQLSDDELMDRVGPLLSTEMKDMIKTNGLGAKSKKADMALQIVAGIKKGAS